MVNLAEMRIVVSVAVLCTMRTPLAVSTILGYTPAALDLRLMWGTRALNPVMVQRRREPHHRVPAFREPARPSPPFSVCRNGVCAGSLSPVGTLEVPNERDAGC
jgi:hypothetical protein